MIDYFNSVADVIAGGDLGCRTIFADPDIAMKIIRVVDNKNRRRR